MMLCVEASFSVDCHFICKFIHYMLGTRTFKLIFVKLTKYFIINDLYTMWRGGSLWSRLLTLPTDKIRPQRRLILVHSGHLRPFPRITLD